MRLNVLINKQIIFLFFFQRKRKMRQVTMLNGYPLSNEMGSSPKYNVRPSRHAFQFQYPRGQKGTIPGVTSMIEQEIPQSSSSFLTEHYSPEHYSPEHYSPEHYSSKHYSPEHYSSKQYSSKQYSSSSSPTDEEEEDKEKKEKTLISHLPKFISTKSQNDNMNNTLNNALINDVTPPSFPNISPNLLPCVLVHNHIVDCPICSVIYIKPWYKEWLPWIIGIILGLFVLWLWHRRCIHLSLIHHLQEMVKQMQTQISRPSSSSSHHHHRSSSSNPQQTSTGVK